MEQEKFIYNQLYPEYPFSHPKLLGGIVGVWDMLSGGYSARCREYEENKRQFHARYAHVVSSIFTCEPRIAQLQAEIKDARGSVVLSALWHGDDEWRGLKWHFTVFSFMNNDCIQQADWFCERLSKEIDKYSVITE